MIVFAWQEIKNKEFPNLYIRVDQNDKIIAKISERMRYVDDKKLKTELEAIIFDSKNDYFSSNRSIFDGDMLSQAMDWIDYTLKQQGYKLIDKSYSKKYGVLT